MNNAYKLVSVKNITQKSKLKEFDCGIEALNDFLSRYSLKNDLLGIGKTFAALDENEKIAGYFTLAAAQVSYKEIPDDYRGKLPKYPVSIGDFIIFNLTFSLNLSGCFHFL